MNNRSVLADHPQALDALLLANVLNDIAGDVALVQQHRVARTGNHDVGNLRDVTRHHTLQVFLPLFEKKHGNKNARHGKRDKQIDTDSKLELILKHLPDRKSSRIHKKLLTQTGSLIRNRPSIAPYPSSPIPVAYHGWQAPQDGVALGSLCTLRARLNQS